ncbi:Cerato-platanin [Cubamyces menziesii]|nr:Cerato-platanin [Cubamyces menziesii]
MRFTYLASLILATVVLSAAEPGPLFTTVTWDSVYDNPDGSLTTVACSTGKNGMITKGFNYFKELPSFPFIGGGDVIEAYDSVNCGSCWALVYEGVLVTVLAIDSFQSGFNIAEEAMDVLTGNRSRELGQVEITAYRFPNSQCGLED